MSKGYIEIPCPDIGQPTVFLRAYAKGDVRIIVSRNIYPDGLRWHLSISCKKRYPVWDEIRDARYALLPNDCTMAMLLPPKEQYVNIHPNTFHLHEIVEE